MASNMVTSVGIFVYVRACVFFSVDISAKVRDAQLKRLTKNADGQDAEKGDAQFEQYRMAMQVCLLTLLAP